MSVLSTGHIKRSSCITRRYRCSFFEYNFPNGSQEEKVKREENEHIKNFSDAFAALCVANCELDKEQNYTDDVTGGNVKYNEKRFDNLTNDSVISQIVSDEKSRKFLIKSYMYIAKLD